MLKEKPYPLFALTDEAGDTVAHHSYMVEGFLEEFIDFMLDPAVPSRSRASLTKDGQHIGIFERRKDELFYHPAEPRFDINRDMTRISPRPVYERADKIAIALLALIEAEKDLEADRNNQSQHHRNLAANRLLRVLNGG
jgi:hypothetical protein